MSPYLKQGSPLLYQKAEEIKEEEILSEEIQGILAHMFEIAKQERDPSPDSRGMIGLAAPQIGISRRIVLVDVGFNDVTKEYGEIKAYINPEIIFSSKELSTRREGCFSVDVRIGGILQRPERIKVRAFDPNGQVIIEEHSGIIARIFQHEIDHLDGICFPDRIGENGVLHWVEEKDYLEYRKNWENWPIRCPWDVWTSAKNGKN